MLCDSLEGVIRHSAERAEKVCFYMNHDDLGRGFLDYRSPKIHIV